MKLLVDMNLTPRWVSFLTASGFECQHWSKLGNASATDCVITKWARDNGFVILTNDTDFPQILAHTRDSGPSVAPMRGEPLTPEVRGSALLFALKHFEEELRAGAIATINWSDKLRVRVLPLP
jgi:predicted nuclease of predicted toxin-antitoxin system